MIGEFSILTAIKTIYDIIEKTFSHYKNVRDKRSEKGFNVKAESQEILEEVSRLIDHFTQTCDLIVLTLAEWSDSPHKYSNTAFTKITQANRRLFEISSDMRIVANSISTRLPNADTGKVQSITDSCVQIILVESFIGAEFIERRDFDLLPIDVSPKTSQRACGRLFHGERVPSGAKMTISTLNKALLELRGCKEALSKALAQIH
jgi:hypothetical protein